MMDEAFPTMYRLVRIVSRYTNAEIRAQFDANNHDVVSGAGDLTLEEELKTKPRSEALPVTSTKFSELPEDNESVFAITEHMLDLMPPTHLWRGILCVPGAAFFGLTAWVCYQTLSTMIERVASGASVWTWVSDPIFIAISGFFAWLFWYVLVSFDWFHYRANPIRMDRKRRLIHVWRSKRAGGPYSIQWGEELVFLRGSADQHGHMDYTTLFLSIDPVTHRIKRRIPVGKPIRDRKRGEAFYEYIRRFMEEGRSAVPEPRYRARMTPSLAYSFNAWFNFTGIAEQRRKGEWGFLGWLLVIGLSPLLTLLSLSHFIAMLTSRTPRWPAEMR